MARIVPPRDRLAKPKRTQPAGPLSMTGPMMKNHLALTTEF